MYKLSKCKKKLIIKGKMSELSGFLFGKVHTINGVKILNIRVFDKDIIYSIVKKQVNKKYDKLIKLLTDVLISDDDTSSGLNLALSEMEKFRQIIKNKYKIYLAQKDLSTMSKKLNIIKKELNNRYNQLVVAKEEEFVRGSHK